jgi:hypothetical protein
MRERMTAVLVLRMFRAGLNTHQIAERLDHPEHKVEKLLIKAREDDRDFDAVAAVPAVDEPSVESGER